MRQAAPESRLALIAALSAITGCSPPPKQTAVMAPAPVAQAARDDACPSLPPERERKLRAAVEARREVVEAALRSSARMKGAKLSVTAHFDRSCKILEAPGAFVNIAAPFDPRHKAIADGVAKRHSDNLIRVYNNIGNGKS